MKLDVPSALTGLIYPTGDAQISGVTIYASKIVAQSISSTVYGNISGVAYAATVSGAAGYMTSGSGGYSSGNTAYFTNIYVDTISVGLSSYIQFASALRGYLKITASDTVIVDYGWTAGEYGSATTMSGKFPCMDWFCDPAIYGYGGTVRVKATLSVANVLNVYLLKNGSGVVTWNTAGAKTQDVAVVAGDRLTMWAEPSEAGGAKTDTVNLIQVCGNVAAGP